MERFNTLMVDIDIFEIIDLLQMEVAGVKQDVATRMVIYLVKKTFECSTIMKIFTWMDLVANINAIFLKGVEDRGANGEPAL